MATNAYKMMTISKGDQSFTLRIDEDEYEKILQDPALVASYWQMLSKSETSTGSQDDKSEIADDDITEIPVSPKQFQEKPEVRRKDKDTPIWTNSRTLRLIEFRKELDTEFYKPQVLNSGLWKEIAEKINNEDRDFGIRGEDCDNKWRNLLNTYRKFKSKQNDLSFPTKWEYFPAIDEIMGHKFQTPSINDVKQNKPAKKRKLQESCEDNYELEVPFSTQTSLNRKTNSQSAKDILTNKKPKVNGSVGAANYHKCSSTSPPKWFLEYEKRQEQRWNKWEKITQNKLEAIKQLTTVLTELVESEVNV